MRQLHREDPQKKADWPHTIFKVSLSRTGQILHSQVTHAWLPSQWPVASRRPRLPHSMCSPVQS